MSTESPRWSRLDPDVRRSEIVDAAGRLFTSRPFAAVSITAIAEEAGVSRALVTHYFGGKRELFLEVLSGLGDLSGAVPRTDLGLPIEETVARNVDAWLDFMESHRELAFAIATLVSLDRDPEVARVVDDMRDTIVDRMVVNHFGSTEVPPHVRLVLRAYTGVAQVAVSDWLATGRATREQVRVLMTRGLLALVREVIPALEPSGGAPAAD
ncbi:TetR/AcrR family transcriptional regulator [Conexibacter woesei]|uniref:Transcriptional regulator, TetR family n=1 Tax=Conexibacter woesei (strain DSM 14684 / CCUG 47730 / CIP 108061 / JCM 11494 / NBRC 100937 / ID131577) TaxID=469383 RepID=D3FAC1_CONWI|nr:TetR/AcrR family transcriptional regulator [Conexibacter woesei]ADB49190.1 transcriptional regulator, TetR family [Conexibacter woesei DSM 14684]